MRNTGPVSFGARLATHSFKVEEVAWFFNVPSAPTGDTEPEQPEADDFAGLIQVGPLDV